MRSPSDVLNNLVSNTRKKDYKFRRLYRNLYNEKFYLVAYERIADKPGNLTPGIDGNTIDGMSIQKIRDLIDLMRSEKYKPNPVRRVYIPKNTGKRRPLGIPSFEDKLVQEVVRMILESIYENHFSEFSHGFRPNRSCHTALNQIRINYRGVKWFIEGDIKSFFDNIDHHILIEILRKKIEDECFLRLIWKFLRAGYTEDWTYHKTYSGTPQGGIISPILSNIYLNEFDQFMENLIKDFNKGDKRGENPEYRHWSYKSTFYKKKIAATELDSPSRQVMLKKYKKAQIKLRSVPSKNPMDKGYRRLVYTRYADDWIIGVIGNKEETIEVKNKIAKYLKNQLKVELSEEKTLVTHSSKFARFLGYDITVTRDNIGRKEDRIGRIKRIYNAGCKLYVPNEKWVKKLIESRSMIIKDGHKWIPLSRMKLTYLEDIEILHLYNAEIRGMYNYYRFATNVSVLHKYFYIMKYSFLKTLAHKYRSSVRKMYKKYSRNGNIVIYYKTKTGEKTTCLYNDGFKVNRRINSTQGIDQLPNSFLHTSKNSLIKRLTAEKCEWCEAENAPLEIHHIKKLKDLKGKKQWEKLMISRRRKTMALCKTCHTALHNEKLD